MVQTQQQQPQLYLPQNLRTGIVLLTPRVRVKLYFIHALTLSFPTTPIFIQSFWLQQS